MSEVSSVREYFSDTKITNTDVIILSNEYVHGFDISVKDFTFVNVIQTYAHLEEVLPYSFLREGSRMHVRAKSVIEKQLCEISLVTELHDDV